MAEAGITTARALELLEGVTSSLEAELVPLPEAAGRVLARPFFAPGDVPPFSRAAMDGYAVRAADVAGASATSPRVLRIQGSILAGEVALQPLEPGAAYRVATGAQLPPGADAVVRQETTALDDSGERVLVFRPVEPERDVVRQGADVAAGQLLLPAGWTLHANDLGLLASFGLTEVEVVRRPRVAYVETGSELVPPGSPLPPGHIYGSNGLVLAARAREHGAEVVARRRVGDDLDALRACFAEVAAAADVAVSTGGVSVGPRDAVPAALEALGFRILFRGLRLMPGRPMIVAVGPGVLWFALSGNPAAALITHELFVRPVLWRMAGWRFPQGFSPAVRARLAGPLPERTGRPRYYLARLRGIGGEAEVELDHRHRATGLAAPFPFNAIAEIPARGRLARHGDGGGPGASAALEAVLDAGSMDGPLDGPAMDGPAQEVTVYVADLSLVAALGRGHDASFPPSAPGETPGETLECKGSLREKGGMGRSQGSSPPHQRRSPVVLAFCGHSGSGKTTLITRLIPRLRERGWRVAVIKHGHRFDLDRPGKDSWRFRQAGAEAVVLASEAEVAYMGETRGPVPLERLLDLAAGPGAAEEPTADSPDIVLLEGFKAVPLPKILVLRDDEVYSEHPLAGDPYLQAVYGGIGGDQSPVPAFPRIPLGDQGGGGEDRGAGGGHPGDGGGERGELSQGAAPSAGEVADRDEAADRDDGALSWLVAWIDTQRRRQGDRCPPWV